MDKNNLDAFDRHKQKIAFSEVHGVDDVQAEDHDVQAVAGVVELQVRLMDHSSLYLPTSNVCNGLTRPRHAIHPPSTIEYQNFPFPTCREKEDMYPGAVWLAVFQRAQRNNPVRAAVF